MNENWPDEHVGESRHAFISELHLLSTHSMSPTPPMRSHSGLSDGGHTLVASTAMHATNARSFRIFGLFVMHVAMVSSSSNVPQFLLVQNWTSYPE